MRSPTDELMVYVRLESLFAMRIGCRSPVCLYRRLPLCLILWLIFLTHSFPIVALMAAPLSYTCFLILIWGSCNLKTSLVVNPLVDCIMSSSGPALASGNLGGNGCSKGWADVVVWSNQMLSTFWWHCWWPVVAGCQSQVWILDSPSWAPALSLGLLVSGNDPQIDEFNWL